MSRSISQILANSETFQTWLERTNDVLEAFSDTVTVQQNTAGDTTSGNGFVTGILGSTTLTANTLRGGDVENSNNLNITSNTLFTGAQINATSNVYIVGANLQFNSNSTITALKITGNSSSTNTIIGGNHLRVTSNSVFSDDVSIIENLTVSNSASFINISSSGTTDLTDVTVSGTLTVSNLEISDTLELPNSVNVNNLLTINTLSANGSNGNNNDILQSDGTSTYWSNTIEIYNIIANSSSGTNKYVLTSDGTKTYWNNPHDLHGNTDIIIDADGDTYLTSPADDFFRIVSSGKITFDLTSTTLNVNTNIIPKSNNSLSLGNSTFVWSSARITNTIITTLTANNSAGANGKLLSSNGTNAFWDTAANSSHYWSNTSNKFVDVNTIWSAAEFQTIEYSSSITANLELGINFITTLTGSPSILSPSNSKPGQSGLWLFIQDSSGGHTPSFSAAFKFPSNTAPSFTTNANSISALSYSVVNSTFITCVLLNNLGSG